MLNIGEGNICFVDAVRKLKKCRIGKRCVKNAGKKGKKKDGGKVSVNLEMSRFRHAEI